MSGLPERRSAQMPPTATAVQFALLDKRTKEPIRRVTRTSEILSLREHENVREFSGERETRARLWNKKTSRPRRYVQRTLNIVFNMCASAHRFALFARLMMVMP